MEMLALLPGLFAAYVAWRHSAGRAFFDVYLPVLLCLPDYYRWISPVLPDPTFNMSAILPIAAIYFLKERGSWRFSSGDALVGGYAFCVGFSEFTNVGYGDAQNLMFETLSCVVLPYALAKMLVEPVGARVAFARRMVWLCFWVSLISIFEFKMGMTPWRILLDPLFPGHADGWVTTFRWGFARVAGPYGHAILAGAILVIAYRLQRWLEWSGHWEPRFESVPWLRMTKARVITLGVLAGLLMTMVRGPWLGSLLGTAVTAIGRRRNRWTAVFLMLVFLVLIAVPLGYWAYRYVSVGRINAVTVAQESAAYRKELIDQYIEIALQRSVWGWGRNKFPVVSGMTSIDNHFLFLFLMHGGAALGCFLGIFLWMMWRLFWRGMRAPADAPPGSLLSFTLLGIYWAIFFSIMTVYLGNQLLPLFFLITGWTEGYLLSEKEECCEEAAEPVLPFAAAPRFQFGRVIE